MAIIDHLHVADLFHRGATATTTKEKWDALEKAICYVFSRVPGMLIKKTNRRNAFDTEEIDIAFLTIESQPDFYLYLGLFLSNVRTGSYLSDLRA